MDSISKSLLLILSKFSLWNVQSGEQESLIDGKRDVGGGRGKKDVRTSASSASGKVHDYIYLRTPACSRFL